MICILSAKEQSHLNKKAVGYIMKKKYKEAKKTLIYALTSPEIWPPLQLSMLNNLACVYNNFNNFKKSLEYLKTSLSIAKKLSTTYVIGVLMNIASTLSCKGSHLTSIKYYFKVLQNHEFPKSAELKSVVFYNIAIEYYNLNKINKSINYFRKGWAYSSSFPDNVMITKLLLSAYTRVLPIIPQNPEVHEAVEKPNHKRNNTYTEQVIKTTAQSSMYTSPRHSFKVLPTVQSFRNIHNSLQITENTPVFTNYTQESSLASPLYIPGFFQLSEKNEKKFDLCAKIEFLKQTLKGYERIVKEFRISSSEISANCFGKDMEYFLDNLDYLKKVQKCCKKWYWKRWDAAIVIQRFFLEYFKLKEKIKLKVKEKSALSKYKSKVSAGILKSILKNKQD